MASDADDFNKNIENLKDSVKKSFANIYASLKARELKTLRQLDAISKQCQDNKDLKQNCVQNIQISYENESTLLHNISNYGAINLEKLNFDSSIFTLEDYISPNDDHLYSYKCIEDLANENDLEAIEEAALKQITSTEDCVCYVNVRSEDVAKKFRHVDICAQVPPSIDSSIISSEESTEPLCSKDSLSITESKDEERSESSDNDEVKKMKPTDEWLNSIKSQTETEPTQVTDVMEHSTIVCS
ncbi:hypothetical protein JYU34_016892 [Plutella xylostella]|uniref:Uncharacterized protein n=1 Tax=Plutella xylostella TaxID=51655 RepID=A0ABQ7Q7G9_PLUXY|nr:hypothetical protein JYU34_016892 [Plutella xylostella]